MEETLLLPGCGLVSGLALLECNLGGGGRAGRWFIYFLYHM